MSLFLLVGLLGRGGGLLVLARPPLLGVHLRRALLVGLLLLILLGGLALLSLGLLPLLGQRLRRVALVVAGLG